MKITTQAKALAEKTANAYSFDRYRSWPALCQYLLSAGFSEMQSEAILRSKWTRWSADSSNTRYGLATAKDLKRFIEKQANIGYEVAALIGGTFP